jgi:pyrroloquinoline quinone biosynthesis protein E
MAEELSSLYIYLTDECNLKCIHCWQSAPLAGKGVYSALEFDTCRNFLDTTLEMGLKNITFSGGEPLLNPEFHKFVEYFHKNHIGVTVETNGMLILDEPILQTIKDYNVFCAISIDGINPDTHNKHRGNPFAFKKTVQGIDALEREKIKYQLIMSISRFNYHELIPLLDFVKQNWPHCAQFKINMISASGRALKMKKKGLLFQPGEYMQITEDIAALIEQYPFHIMLHLDPVFFSFKSLMLKFSCGGHCGYKSSLSILANGNVSICSLGKQVPKYIFGHVSSIDVKEIWNTNPILKDIHEDTHTKLKGICSNCIFRKQCLGGCRAEALCAYDDFFAPHPRCQEFYESGKFPGSRLINQSSFFSTNEDGWKP